MLDSLAFTAFGVGGWPGVGLRFDVPGSVPPAHTVRYVLAVASTAVMLRARPTASVGIALVSMHRPFDP